MRSPLFKLNPITGALVLLGPTALAKTCMTDDMFYRLDTMWKIHENREEKGLGGSWKPSEKYHDKFHMAGEQEKYGQITTLHYLFVGSQIETKFNDPFSRWTPDHSEYGFFHEDYEKPITNVVEGFERFDKSVEYKNIDGEWALEPLQDKED